MKKVLRVILGIFSFIVVTLIIRGISTLLLGGSSDTGDYEELKDDLRDLQEENDNLIDGVRREDHEPETIDSDNAASYISDLLDKLRKGK